MIDDDLKKGRTGEAKEVQEYLRRLDDMLDFLNVMNALFNLVVTVGSKGVGRLSKVLSRLAG